MPLKSMEIMVEGTVAQRISLMRGRVAGDIPTSEVVHA